MKIIKRKKQLNFAMPDIRVYPHIANIMAMCGCNPYLMPEIVSEMIGLVYDKETERMDFAISLEMLQYMNNYPLMYSHAVSRTIITKKWKSFSEFLIDVIDEDYYVISLVDTFYISDYSRTYGKSHYLHDPMIYGYDEKTRTFTVADAFDNGKYVSKQISFEEIDNSFVDGEFNDWLEGVRLFKLRERPFKWFGCNAEYIEEQCRIYVEGTEPSASTYIEKKRRKDFSERFTYGIRIYDELIDYTKKSIGLSDWNNIDVRLFYVLYDHFKIYEFLIKNLSHRNLIINSDELYIRFCMLSDRMKNLCMTVLKFNVSGKKSILEKIISELENIREEDLKSVKEFADSLLPNEIQIKEEREKLVKPDKINAMSILAEYSKEEDWSRIYLNEPIKYSKVCGAYVKLQFYGEGVKLTIKKSADYGRAKVFIDEKLIKEIDYAGDEGNCVEIINGIEAGYHILRLEKSDNTAKYINVSDIEVVSETKTPVKAVVRKKAFETGVKGNLIKDYGSNGWEIIGAEKKLPDYMTRANYVYHHMTNVILMHKTVDDRGVKINGDSREATAAYALNSEEFILEMTVAGKERNVTLYAVDYDNLERAMRVEIIDADNNILLDKCEIKEYSRGIKLEYKVKGHIYIRFIKEAGPDVVLSAVYFD